MLALIEVSKLAVKALSTLYLVPTVYLPLVGNPSLKNDLFSIPFNNMMPLHIVNENKKNKMNIFFSKF